MKLFIVAALVTVAAAGRLEHLERSYLPPNQASGSGQYSSQPTFGSNSLGGFGGSGSHFGSQGSNDFGSSGLESLRSGSLGSSGSFGSSAFPGATINQYLPPDHGPSSGTPQFSGSLQGFSNGNQRSQYTPQYTQNTFGSSSFGSQGQAQRYSQFPATNRQYLAPSSGPSYPQQAFDDETGYHY